MPKSRLAGLSVLLAVGVISLPLLAGTAPALASARPGTTAGRTPFTGARPMAGFCGYVHNLHTDTVLTTSGGTTVPADEPVSVTATVTHYGTPLGRGEVEFLINGKVVAESGLSPGGQATASLSLPAGNSRVNAHFEGIRCDGDPGTYWVYDPSTSKAITFTTTPPYTSKVSGTFSYGKRTTTTVEVTMHIDFKGFTGYGAPTGPVSADDSLTCVGLTPISGTVVSKATCTAVIPNTASEDEDVDITYSGDSTYAPAEVSVAVFAIWPTMTTITVATPQPVAGQPIEVDVDVASEPDGPISPPTPAGVVTVSDGTQSCQATLSGSGGVTTGGCTITEYAPGTYTFNSSYGGSADCAASATATGTPVTVSSPPPPNLMAVSCTSTRACTAVGYFQSENGFLGTGAEAWNGSRWSSELTPNSADGYENKLSAVSCTSSTACTAVGYYEGESVFSTLAEAWNGTTWSIETTPSLSGNAGLSGVSCSSANACTAVGAGPDGTLAETWNGTTWSVEPTPNPVSTPAQYGLGLTAVSCTSATACTAVGSYENGGTDSLTLAEVWNGETWVIEPTPTSDTAGMSLSAVSCTSATACSAVGAAWELPGFADESTLAEGWNGTTWAVEPTPSTGGLSGVSCMWATWCMAVGSGAADVWNGTTWTVEPTPSTGGLSGVSCTSTRVCTAVGDSGLAEAWNGTRWSHEP